MFSELNYGQQQRRWRRRQHDGEGGDEGDQITTDSGDSDSGGCTIVDEES